MEEVGKRLEEEEVERAQQVQLPTHQLVLAVMVVMVGMVLKL